MEYSEMNFQQRKAVVPMINGNVFTGCKVADKNYIANENNIKDYVENKPFEIKIRLITIETYSGGFFGRFVDRYGHEYIPFDNDLLEILQNKKFVAGEIENTFIYTLENNSRFYSLKLYANP